MVDTVGDVVVDMACNIADVVDIVCNLVISFADDMASILRVISRILGCYRCLLLLYPGTDGGENGQKFVDYKYFPQNFPGGGKGYILKPPLPGGTLSSNHRCPNLDF